MSRIMNKREDKLMHLLWERNQPTSIEEMRYLSDEKVSKATLFKAVQSLSKKGYLVVAGFEPTTKTYARKFMPGITQEDYAAILLRERGLTMESFGSLAAAMLGNEENDNKDQAKEERLIEELEKIIAEIRNREK